MAQLSHGLFFMSKKKKNNNLQDLEPYFFFLQKTNKLCDNCVSRSKKNEIFGYINFQVLKNMRVEKNIERIGLGPFHPTFVSLLLPLTPTILIHILIV